jgi:hypothetical protein
MSNPITMTVDTETDSVLVISTTGQVTLVIPARASLVCSPAEALLRFVYDKLANHPEWIEQFLREQGIQPVAVNQNAPTSSQTH